MPGRSHALSMPNYNIMLNMQECGWEKNDKYRLMGWLCILKVFE